MQEHDYEPQPGLPEALPDGERLLWQGAADARSLAIHTFHVRKLAVYFGALIALRIVFKIADGVSLTAALGGSIGLAVAAVGAIALLLIYARYAARSTNYTITSKRIVIRCGIAVPITMNLPFASIESADLRLHRDGTGDIAVRTDASGRASYVLLWPFVKPWRWVRVQPVLRAVPDAESVSSLLADAFGGYLASPDVRAPRPEPQPEKGKSRRGWGAYPTVPLTAATSLIVIALVAVAWMRISGETPGGHGEYEIAESVELLFEDRDDGSIVVIDAADSVVVEVLEPGTNGFLRGALRSFARHRRAVEAGSDIPFSIRRTATGRLVLHDLATGEEIDLRAFGETNAGVFARFLETAPADPVAMDADSVSEDDDIVALTRQEATQ